MHSLPLSVLPATRHNNYPPLNGTQKQQKLLPSLSTAITSRIGLCWTPFSPFCFLSSAIPEKLLVRHNLSLSIPLSNAHRLNWDGPSFSSSRLPNDLNESTSSFIPYIHVVLCFPASPAKPLSIRRGKGVRGVMRDAKSCKGYTHSSFAAVTIKKRASLRPRTLP